MGLCRGIASFGIVVVAVTQGTCGEWSVQQMHAVTGSQQNSQLHMVLPYVDFSSIGVIGHSEGGAYTMESATKANQFPIKPSSLLRLRNCRSQKEEIVLGLPSDHIGS